MTKSFIINTVLACSAALVIAMPRGAQGAAIIFDDFNVNEGHFTSTPATGSGSSSTIDPSSTADRVTTDSPLEGAGHQKFVLVPKPVNLGGAIRLRHLSGGGSAANNVAFTTSAAEDGWIGVYIKTLDATTDPNWTVQIYIEGASTNGSVPKTVIADGDWHLYEWDLDNTAGDADGWGPVGGIIAGVPTVTDGSHTIDSIIFRNPVGPASSTFFMDFVAKSDSGSVEVVLMEPCRITSGVLVTGPLSTNSDQVVVTGVSGTATAITVYQDSGAGMVQIATKTTGITAGTNLVATTGLLKGAQVSATQTVGGQESCLQSFGALVGGGANPRVRIVYTIRETISEGPVGAAGDSTGANLHFLGASFRIGSAPGDGPVLFPSDQWQSVTLQRGPDPAMPTNSSIQWFGAGIGDTNDLQGQWGILESINFAIDDLTDTGPYDLYIDNLQNGSTVFQTFEDAAVGAQDFGFRAPSFSGTTDGSLLSAPNQSIVSDAAADTGTKSLRVQFQWNGTNDTKWLRLTTSGIGDPQVNLADPTTIRFLLLPVGSTPVPNLGISLSGTMATITWPGTSFTLQCTTNLIPVGMPAMIPWADVPGSVTSPYTYDTSSGPQKFFRLRK